MLQWTSPLAVANNVENNKLWLPSLETLWNIYRLCMCLRGEKSFNARMLLTPWRKESQNYTRTLSSLKAVIYSGQWKIALRCHGTNVFPKRKLNTFSNNQKFCETSLQRIFLWILKYNSHRQPSFLLQNSLNLH